ncbi:MAG TPA: hypothetical protein VFF06_24950 [Polyangia bacterium]|nr:hypothetical protein [Polyangia bacterium]
MTARLRGAVVLDVAAAQLPAARDALARAVATGALGPGYSAALDGEAVVFAGGARGDRPSGGRFELFSDGRASYSLAVGWTEFARVAQAVGVAAALSVSSVIWWSWMFHRALPFGAAGGLAWAAARIALDRRRMRRDARALLRSLPLLLK